MEEDVNEFLAALERDNGGPVQLKTYGLWLGANSAPGQPEVGGLLYVIQDRLFFEDFEKQAGLLGLIVPKSKKNRYVKFKTSIDIHAIEQISCIRIKHARQMVQKNFPDNFPVVPLQGFWKKFFQTALYIRTSDGTVWLLDVFDVALITEFMEEHV